MLPHVPFISNRGKSRGVLSAQGPALRLAGLLPIAYHFHEPFFQSLGRFGGAQT
jgi:hypothetical protein